MVAGRAYTNTLSKDLLRVEVADVMYAIDVSRVAEIINPLPLVDLPRDREPVLGVTEYRDQVLAVVDLRRFFGVAAAEPTKRTKWVIVRMPQRLAAFVVDAVVDVFSSQQQPYRPVPALDSKHEMRGIKSAFKHRGELVFHLDVERLTRPAAAAFETGFPAFAAERK